MVLPATGGSDLEDMAAAMRPLRARRLIATKLDMVRRLGGLVRAALAGRLALSLGSASPYIADLPEAMQPFSLARRLLGAHPMPESH
jgi:flagellar biosynthesis protein FlhF